MPRHTGVPLELNHRLVWRAESNTDNCQFGPGNRVVDYTYERGEAARDLRSQRAAMPAISPAASSGQPSIGVAPSVSTSVPDTIPTAATVSQ